MRPGWLFAALPGAKADGAQFVADAIAKGAAAVLLKGDATIPVPARVALLKAPSRVKPWHAWRRASGVGNPAPSLPSRAPAARPRWPTSPGKSSTTWAQGGVPWHPRSGEGRCCSVRGFDHPGSGHAASRLWPGWRARTALPIWRWRPPHTGSINTGSTAWLCSAAAFTNLGRDHLDYHASMDAYLRRSSACWVNFCRGWHRRHQRRCCPRWARACGRARRRSPGRHRR